MISKKDTKILIKAIGKNHVVKISQFAKKQGFLKEDGEEYSKTLFSLVLHGHRDMPEVEKLIFDCAEYHLDIREANELKLEKLAKRVNKTK